jgi:hypothetical protein
LASPLPGLDATRCRSSSDSERQAEREGTAPRGGGGGEGSEREREREREGRWGGRDAVVTSAREAAGCAAARSGVSISDAARRGSYCPPIRSRSRSPLTGCSAPLPPVCAATMCPFRLYSKAARASPRHARRRRVCLWCRGCGAGSPGQFFKPREGGKTGGAHRLLSFRPPPLLLSFLFFFLPRAIVACSHPFEQDTRHILPSSALRS